VRAPGERGKGRGEEAGAEVEEQLQLFPTPSFIASEEVD